MEFLLWLGGLVGLAGGVWGLFLAADAAIPDSRKIEPAQDNRILGPDGRPVLNKPVRNLRHDISVWLDIPPLIENWPDTWIRVFDSLFGRKHLSWKCFWRSCVTSFCTVGGMLLIWLVLNPIDDTAFSKILYAKDGKFIFLTIILPVSLNLLLFYIALLKTRFLLSFMRSSHPSLIMVLLLDVALTTAIFYGFALTFCSFASYFNLTNDLVYCDLSFEELVLFHSQSTQSALSVYFYSIFFTSVWLWLYSFSVLIVDMVQGFGSVVRKFLSQDISERLLDQSVKLPSKASKMFDRIFRQELFSWHAFGWSCVISYICVLGVTFLWIILDREHFRLFAQSENIVDVYAMPGYLFGGAQLFNLIPDYLALAEGRFILQKISSTESKSVFTILLFFFLDILASAGIIFSWWAGWLWLWSWVLEKEMPSILSLPGQLPYGIWLYSAFASSIIVALLSIFTMIARTFSALEKELRRLPNEPIRALGMNSALIVTVLYLAATVLSLVF